MTRVEHMNWCKKRALEYLDKGDVSNAITSMMSDMNKHDETNLEPTHVLTLLGLRAAMSGDPQEARRYIEGFN